MYKINNVSLTYKYIILMIFAGMITHKFNPNLVYFFTFAFISILLFFKVRTYQLSLPLILYILLVILALNINFFYQLIQYSYNNFYYIQFFASQVFFILLFGLYINIKKIRYKYLESFFLIMIIFGSLLIVIDYLLLLYGMGSSQIMYKPGVHSYSTKPMGIFGQFSINSTYLISSYLFWLSIAKNPSSNTKMILFLIITLAIFMQDSGTGYVLYFILLLTLLWKYKYIKMILLPIIIAVTYVVIYNGLIEKISYESFSREC